MAGRADKGVVIGVVVAAVVLIAVIIGVIIMNGGGGDGMDEGEESGQVEDNSVEVDFSNVDVAVGYGDYDVMFAQSKAIQNGEMTGKIITIDGIVSHPMTKYSIVEESSDGTQVGTEFVIDGVDESEYPKDGDHAIITGVVVEKAPLYFVIKTTPEYVEILESDAEIEEEPEVDSEEADVTLDEEDF